MDDFNVCVTNCRLCLREEKFQIPIFGEIGNEMQIVLKMKTCLPIQVSKDDFFPKHICYKCLASLDQSYNLWKQSYESEVLVKNLTSKLSVNLLNSSSTNEMISKPKNRTILLSSGGTLNEDTDSENDGPPNITKLDNDLEDDHSPHNTTACVWPDGGEDDLMITDSSPDFLESLEEEFNHPRDGNVQKSCQVINKTDDVSNLPDSVQRIPNMQMERNISDHSFPYITNFNKGPHYLLTDNTNLKSPDSSNINFQMSETNASKFQSAHLTSTGSASYSNFMIPNILTNHSDRQTPRMTFTPSCLQIPNAMSTVNNTSIPHIQPNNSFTPNTRPLSTPNTFNFNASSNSLYSVSDVVNLQTLDPSTVRLHSVMSRTNLQIPSNSPSKQYTNVSTEETSIPKNRLGYVNNNSQTSSPSSGSNGGHITATFNSHTSSGMRPNSVIIANNSQTSETSPSTRLRSTSLFQMSPDSWRKFLKK